MSEKEILLIAPRGFCAGVERAVEILDKALELNDGKPLYVNHEIVHNNYVVGQFKEKGVIFVDEISEVPENSTIVFSAHGVSPKVWEEAKSRDLEVIDATCPLVTKVHLEAKRYAKENYTIALIGHKNHVEAKGTFGEAPQQTVIIESIKDIDNLREKNTERLAYLTQTTLSLMDTKEIIIELKKQFPHIESPPSSDICYATTNRQQAVQKVASSVDLMIVIGSHNSSNSNRLKELGEALGTKACLTDNAESFDKNLINENTKKVGITAGASAPDELIQEMITMLKEDFGFNKLTEVQTTEENVVFKLPKKLREKAAM
jgi:4-hydroxy-3-methylbut-2-en-1-yl diphosphate reductase